MRRLRLGEYYIEFIRARDALMGLVLTFAFGWVVGYALR